MDLLHHQVVELARRMRQEGVRVGPADVLAACHGLREINLLDRTAVYYTLRAYLCGTPDEQRRFHRVFLGLWVFPTDHAGVEQATEALADQSSTRVTSEGGDAGAVAVDGVAARSGGDADAEDDIEAQVAELDWEARMEQYSADEQRVFRRYLAAAPVQRARVHRAFLQQIRPLLQEGPPGRGRRGPISVRKTIRRNLRYGGDDLLELVRKHRRQPRPAHLVLLVDVSGSMNLYVYQYLSVLHDMCRICVNPRVFFFSTQLEEVSAWFSAPFRRTLEALALHPPRLGNGTNLSQALSALQRSSARLSPEDTTVVVFSDGWDSGRMEDLQKAFSNLHSRVAQILWVNPLLGLPDYRPETHALLAARPYVRRMLSMQEVLQVEWATEERG
ncbi:MAG: VWA domain-containing protein [Alicyclobacillus sp.]|nr:VWA domain-containing protein [Alicyclobacillus sp.]